MAKDTKRGSFAAAGSAVKFRIGLVDATGRPTRYFGPACERLEPAMARLAWVRLRNPSAVLIRELLLVEVLQ